ncbi:MULTISPECIES: hypothetical protein [Hyphomonas]|nr:MULTISPECIES: hypothetical protein [Hyphomonas]MBB41600.1 hypothetical protein [Hyphomonas sp.]|tara:strand:- start:1467 stop:4229 length:2763 start_codon:yes stop_codon:yes gene_type:complete
MIRTSGNLDPRDWYTYRTAFAFLNKRLAEQGTIDWALKLKPHQKVERFAIENSLARLGANDLSEPWSTAWRLIEESWISPQPDGRHGAAVYEIRKRLRAGDRSGAVIAALVDLVAPRLKVEPISDWRWSQIKKPRKPTRVDQVLYAHLTSGELIDLQALELANINEVDFLSSLASALEGAVAHGLDIASRLGRTEGRSFAGLGLLYRVYYTQPMRHQDEDSEPDAFHYGIAPSVKLLYAVVARIAELDPTAAQYFVSFWKLKASPVYVRLWAAISRNEQIMPAAEVCSFVLDLDQDQFWDLHKFPEFTELRAVRFRDMDEASKIAITDRIKRGPPRSQWSKRLDAAKIDELQRYWSLRELRRIEVAGGVLPEKAKLWLDAHAAQFEELAEMSIDDDFAGGITVTRREARPDAKFDALEGVERLRALEAALATTRRGWDDDPAERANDWIGQAGNPNKLLTDLEVANNGGDDFPRVWSRFGWAHRPSVPGGPPKDEAVLEFEAATVLALLNQLSQQTMLSAIEGITAWLDTWEKHAIKSELCLPVWMRLWPIAVEVTNLTPEGQDEEDLEIIARPVNDDSEPMDLDTLNTPAGKLVGVFLTACPRLQEGADAFAEGSRERQMRDIVIDEDGRAGLIAKHRMIESLPYFLRADEDWARTHLIAPLLNDDGAALALWRAMARRTHFRNVLSIIGAPMAERAVDRRLGRETRRRLVFSLVIESLHAFRENRAPAVPNPRIQQMLRTLDDEVRASAANAIQQFVRDVSAKPADNDAENGEEHEKSAAAGALFRVAAAPFLREVWPQERSLATPGVSSAFADLPATSGDAFAEAVEAIERFLVPFECWSMLEYGLYGEDEDAKKLAIIDDEQKARALLRLLDLTVGSSEGAVVPLDLTSALDQIESIVPKLAEVPEFRRLSAAARR